MRKIPTLFERDESRRYVTDTVTPGCEWVLAGQGVATRKFDGTCVRYSPNDWWFRREIKPGKEPPPEWVEADADPITGKRMGWEPARPESGFIVPLREAIDNTFRFGSDIPEGTYELCGPRINGNPESFTKHVLVRHGEAHITELPLTFEGLSDWLADSDFEGIVWHHPDGRMAKLKRRDFPRLSKGDNPGADQ